MYELIKPINSKYDIPVKVALSKSLKFMIVDTPQSAEYCTEFLKEKGLFKDLVVLQNVPEKQVNQGTKRLIGNQGELIYDVIEISRKHTNLDKAVRYFLGDKVVCKDFDLAVKLQGLGVRDIVTEEGTEFKQGMISGGAHQNIFNLNFGTFKLDSDWRKLFEVIKKLDEELQVVRQQEKEDNYAHEQQREVAQIEAEVENLKVRIKDQERVIKEAHEKSGDLNKQLNVLEKQRGEVEKDMSSVR